MHERVGSRSAVVVGVVHDGPGHGSHVVATWWLYLDDVGTQIGQKAGPCTRAQNRTIQDPHTCQQAGTGGVGGVGGVGSVGSIAGTSRPGSSGNTTTKTVTTTTVTTTVTTNPAATVTPPPSTKSAP